MAEAPKSKTDPNNSVDISKTILLPICIVLAVFSRYTFAAFGDTCTADSDCTADNAMCVKTSGCAHSSCSSCKTGYIISGGACKADIGTACTLDADCAITTNGECDNGGTDKCICSSGFVHSYKACVTTGEQFGQTCAALTIDADCEVDSGATFGDCISLQCDCEDGYIKGDGHVCRKPYLGEYCINGVGCVAGFGMPDEQDPVCPAGTNECVCDSATDETVTYGGNSFCNTKVADADKFLDTIDCAAHNECQSGRCIQCPDTSSLICVGTDNFASTITMKPALIIVLTFIASMLQL